MGSDLYLQPSTSLVADAHKAGMTLLLSKLGPKQNSRYTYHSARLLSLVLQLHHSNSGCHNKAWVWNMCYRLEDCPMMPMERIGFMLQGRLFDLAPNRKSQVNGQCVDNLKSKASDVNNSSLPGLDIATNQDIIGIYLANLIRLH
ncbi:hypothetical protein L1987_09926 [Smallanthus sonchifolius]|uniref:Uncharacterized protein n=1 Tax=Smallanthus sonchifolius TaxID=185202 RepID=A0ACB9JQN7_9ASTR|nr:hypothetical protein L1987_09926 [Smallanthus sonchifolius]